MQRIIVIIIAGMFFLLFGCGTDTSKEQQAKQDSTIDNSNSQIDQEPSIKAKKTLNEHEGITEIRSVNNTKTLVVAVKVNHDERFTLKSLEKKMTKKLKDEFPKLDVEFSTDLKIFLELDKLKKKMQTGSLTEKELNKELDKIIKLSKKQT
ncbi:YhcN/YlaJ family sporulation lipoprotein [Oceanobacillus chungangensis]|uniref:Sporulation protein n=1 Tax=Oceanobacillus chungangensis TaxID=1229152 RepID=A0A3D8PPV2_9BACI|nr:YhcN/YlaJ family sporulation lipoprotein [Oceanobacillus chungangensis]RDW17994.1 hypothetical protein CWR45_11740 [Oceanobacillus chungangensis]